MRVGFNWGAPCRVPATQEVLKGGHQTSLAFDIVVVPAGRHLEVRLDRMRIVHTTYGASAARAAAALLAAIPSLVVSRRGEIVKVKGTEQAIRRASEVVGAIDPAAGRMFRSLVRQPRIRATIEQRSGDFWNAWVGAWLGLELFPGEARELDDEVTFASGERIPARMRVELAGAVANAPELDLYDLNRVIEGEDALRAVTALLGAGTMRGSLRQEVHITAALDSARGRPHRVREETRVSYGGRAQTEIRDTELDWSTATGCR